MAMTGQYNSHFVAIRAAPADWDKFIIEKFSKYVKVDKVTIEPPRRPGVKTNFVIIDFEFEECARAAVEENRNSDPRVNFYTPLETSPHVYTIIDAPEPKISDEDQLNCQVFPCGNAKCSRKMIAVDVGVDEKISDFNFCSKECYVEGVNRRGLKVDKIIAGMANMGRNGTGMLKDPSKLDKIRTTVDRLGGRWTRFVK